MEVAKANIKSRFILLLTGMLVIGITGSKAQYIADSSIFESRLAGQLLGSAVAHKNRTVYSRLNQEIIDTTADEKLVQVITDHIRTKIDKDLSNEYEVVLNESEPGKNIYIIYQVEAEVNNGGFAQFFSSSAARLSGLAEDAFLSVRATRFAGLIKRANLLYKQEGISDKLKDLDEEFYSLYDKEDINKLKISYIRKNKKALASN